MTLGFIAGVCGILIFEIDMPLFCELFKLELLLSPHKKARFPHKKKL
jgi:hypothetical protein